MDLRIAELLANRTPPTAGEVKDLANKVLRVRDGAGFRAARVESLRSEHGPAFLINDRFCLVWTRESAIRGLDPTRRIGFSSGYPGWVILVADLDRIADFFTTVPFDFRVLEPSRLLKACSSWHKALLEALAPGKLGPSRANTPPYTEMAAHS